MSRDNSDLYTGSTSVSSAKKPTEEEIERKREKEEKAIKLKPAIEILLGLIDTERTKVTDLRSFISAKVKPEDAAFEYRARELYLGYLNGLEQSVKQLTKVKK